MFDRYALHQAARLGYWLHRRKGGNAATFWPKLDFFSNMLRGSALAEEIETMSHLDLGHVDEGFLDRLAEELTPFQKTQTLYFLDQISNRNKEAFSLQELTEMRDLYHRILFGRQSAQTV